MSQQVLDAEVVATDDGDMPLATFAAMVAEFGDPFSAQSSEDWAALKEYAHSEPWWPRDARSVMRHIAAQAGTTATAWTTGQAAQLRALTDHPLDAGTAELVQVVDPRVRALMDKWAAQRAADRAASVAANAAGHFDEVP